MRRPGFCPRPGPPRFAKDPGWRAGQATFGDDMQIAQWKMAANGSSARSPGRPRDAALDGAILAAAVRHLGERGYAGMSIEGVAAAAGTTPPSLRRRYRDKLELAVAGIDAMPTGPLPGPAGEPAAGALPRRADRPSPSRPRPRRRGQPAHRFSV